MVTCGGGHSGHGGPKPRLLTSNRPSLFICAAAAPVGHSSQFAAPETVLDSRYSVDIYTAARLKRYFDELSAECRVAGTQSFPETRASIHRAGWPSAAPAALVATPPGGLVAAEDPVTVPRRLCSWVFVGDLL